MYYYNPLLASCFRLTFKRVLDAFSSKLPQLL
jgi:hypothetical protein